MSVRLQDVTSVLPIKMGHLFIIMALLMGVISVVVFKNISSSTKESAAKAAKVVTRPVVVASNPVAVGATLTADDLKLVEWPEAYMPGGNVFTNTSGLVGRVVKSELLEGEPVFREKLAGDKSSGGLPVIIPKGMRAVTVAVSEVKGVAGFIKPGDRVDVLATFEEKVPTDDSQGSSTKEIQLTKTVLQNVLVIASAQQMINERTGQASSSEEESSEKSDKKDKDKKAEKKERKRDDSKNKSQDGAKVVSSMTLALTPEEAEKLALAEEYGSIRLALRPEADDSLNELGGVTQDELINAAKANASAGKWPFGGGATMKAQPAPAAPPLPVATATTKVHGRTVEFIEGSEKTSLDF